MPYSGPSKGCHHCRQRRIKCDEGRPGCRNCARLKLECKGYRFNDGLSFEDETDKVVKRAEAIENRSKNNAIDSPQGGHGTAPSRSPNTNYVDAAIVFLFTNFAVAVPEHGSRAFLDLVKDRYWSFAPNSPVALATATIATELWGMWSHASNEDDITARLLSLTLQTVNDALTVHEQAVDDNTLMAVLLLQFHVEISRHRNVTQDTLDHLRGARALVEYRGSLNFRSVESTRLFQTVRSYLITSGLRRRIHLDLNPLIWSSVMEEYRSKPAELDILGMEVLALMISSAALDEREQDVTSGMPKHDVLEVQALLSRATAIHRRLEEWRDSVASNWSPTTVAVTRCPVQVISSCRAAENNSITCDIYPSIEAADTWNQYRIYHVLCLGVIQVCCSFPNISADTRLAVRPNFSSTRSDLGVTKDEMQGLVDQICRSVPFHLGSQLQRMVLGQFVEKYGLAWPLNSTPALSTTLNTQDFIKSRISIGSWYMLETLQMLTGLFKPRSEIPMVRSRLRQGQLEWIEGQILRIHRIHGTEDYRTDTEDSLVQESSETLYYVAAL